MNRRSFLRSLGAAVAGIALGEAIPFNRVWSFPSKIVVPVAGEVIVGTTNFGPFLTIPMITQECLRILKENLKFTEYTSVGQQICSMPQRYLIREAA